MGAMGVFAQPTDDNLRICSLLSAVFQRSLNPRFVHALESKAELIQQARQSGATSTQRQESLAIVFLGPKVATETLSLHVHQFSRRFKLDVSAIPVGISSSSNLPATDVQNTLQVTRNTLRFFRRTKRPAILVAVSGGVDLACHFFSDGRLSCDDVLGMVLIDPPGELQQGAFVEVSLPTLILVSRPATPSKRDGGSSDSIGKHPITHTANPNVIVVHTNFTNGIGIDCQWEEPSPDDSNTTSAVHPLYNAYWIWLLRTIAKFSETIAIMHGVRLDPKNNWDRHGRPPRTLTPRSRL